MILASETQHASLAPFLHARAIAATPRRLALDIAIGTLSAAGVYWLRPVGWIVLACGGLCFAAYGTWAFAERRLEMGLDEMPRVAELAWTTLRGLAAVAGFGAVLLFAFTALSLLLGPWIS